jgi:peptidoglycan/xylan/chitin deacetylase (PgdA/CDA1 family)
LSYRQPTVLMYHSIGWLDDDPNMLCTSPKRFEAQILYLKRRGLRGVSMRELHRAVDERNTKGLVGLTFDDGYQDFLSTAVPVLEREGFTATVFVVTNLLGEENDWEHTHEPRPRLKLLDAEGIREVRGRGMEVGSHSLTHARLSGAEPELLNKEVGESRRVLGEILDEAVEGFCYPYGSLDGAAVRAARQAGYAYACGWRALVERSPYDWPRMPMSNRDGFLRFATKLRIYSQYSAAKRFYRAPFEGIAGSRTGYGHRN